MHQRGSLRQSSFSLQHLKHKFYIEEIIIKNILVSENNFEILKDLQFFLQKKAQLSTTRIIAGKFTQIQDIFTFPNFFIYFFKVQTVIPVTFLRSSSSGSFNAETSLLIPPASISAALFSMFSQMRLRVAPVAYRCTSWFSLLYSCTSVGIPFRFRTFAGVQVYRETLNQTALSFT